MKTLIEDIQQKLRDEAYTNEEHVRLSLVCRILLEVGWDIWNPKEVYTEFKTLPSEDNSKVDIALFPKGKFASVYIEIKAHHKIDLQAVERQLRDYNKNNQAPFAIITDGQTWRFYLASAPGEFSDKCFKIIDLLEDVYEQIEECFSSLVSKEAIENVETKKKAEKYLESSVLERAIIDSLSDADLLMHHDFKLNKIDAIKMCLAKVGFDQIEENEIAGILNKNKNAQTNKPIVKHEREVVSDYPQSSIQSKDNKSSTKGPVTTLIIEINGKQISDNTYFANKALIKALDYLGIERAKEVFIKGKFPFIIKENEVKNYPPKKYSEAVKGHYVYTNTQTEAKKRNLENVAKKLGQKIKIKVVTREKP